MAQLNAKSYEVIQGVDRAIVGPVAKTYERGLPEPVRDGLGNFLKNLRESVVFVNYMLQLKPGKAIRTVGRFAINSTLGLGGVIDVAKRKPFNLPRKLNGFEDTFACYGIGPGPYLFLPLIGPTTLRDVIGVSMGRAFVPFAAGEPFNKPYYAIPAATIDMLTTRVEMDADLQRIRAESGDPYTATRDLYLKQRYQHLMELCPKRAAKAFKLPASVKAELKAEGTPVAETAPRPDPDQTRQESGTDAAVQPAPLGQTP
ncbi:MAG: VacJ family lipoprotein [Pseudomonadota bacterium]